MKKYFAESIGAFFLTLSVVLAANNSSIAAMAPLAIGAMLAVMTYAGSHLTGAHFNPAVTLAVLMRGKIDRNEAGAFILFQVVGAVVAATIGVYLHSSSGEPVIPLHGNHDPIGSALAELLGAFSIAYVFINVSTLNGNAGSDGNCHRYS